MELGWWPSLTLHAGCEGALGGKRTLFQEWIILAEDSEGNTKKM